MKPPKGEGWRKMPAVTDGPDFYVRRRDGQEWSEGGPREWYCYSRLHRSWGIQREADDGTITFIPAAS